MVSKTRQIMNLASRGGEECHPCWLFAFLCGFAGLITFAVWIGNTPEQPIFSIEQFYVPALDITAAGDGTLNTSITFDLQLKNPGAAVNYDSLDVTLYHSRNLSSPVGYISMPGFRQGLKKTAHRVETVKTSGVPWTIARDEVAIGTTVFKVDFSTAVTYTMFACRGGRHELRLGANVQVNNQGSKVGKKGIELLSTISLHRSRRQGPNKEPDFGLAES